MPIKSVWLGLNFEEAALNHTEESCSSESYAVELYAREEAHLSVFLAAPLFKIPSVVPGAGLFPIAHTPEDEINSYRRGRAEEAQARIAAAAKSSGVAVEFHIAQEAYPDLRECLIASARPSDVTILSRQGNYLAFDRTMIEAMLFTSGRPMVIIPPDWEKGARLEKVIVAWDGSGRAARAAGDAKPLLSRAEEVEIVCVSRDASRTISSAGLAADLPIQHGGVGATLRAHAKLTRANLLVMGAYAHPRMLEVVIGGVTADMLSEAEFPFFLSH